MYCYQDIIATYKAVGLKRGDNLVLKTDLLKLGRYEHFNKQHILRDHIRAIDEVIDFGAGTLVVATSSTNLCNTDTPFDINNTPSIVGILTEHIRQLPQTIRSYHAFESYAAIGANAEAFCTDLSRFSYGLNTPEDRLVEHNATCVCLGVETHDVLNF